MQGASTASQKPGDGRQPQEKRAQAKRAGLFGRLHDALHPPGAEIIDDASDLRRVMPHLIGIGIVSNLLGLALPLALLQTYDRVIPNQSYSTFALLMGGVVAALALEAVLKVLRGAIMGWLGARFEHRIGLAALGHVFGMPLREYLKDEPGGYVERLRSAGQVREFYSGQAVALLIDLPFALLFLGIIGFIGGWLVLVPLILILTFGIIVIRSGRWMRGQVDLRTTLDKRRFNFLSETLAGIHSVKMLAMEALMHRRYERLQEASVEKGADLARGSAMAAAMGTTFTQMMIVMVVGGGALVVIAGDMTPGALAACILFSVRALQPLRKSLSLWMRYQGILSARKALAELFLRPSEAGTAKPALPPLRGHLELRDVTVLRPGKGEPLFTGLDLTVEAGECVAILGDSGSGKSALLNLLNGMAGPDSGAVLADGLPLNTVDPRTIPLQIAFLPQQSSLLRGTILENITMFNPALNDAALAIARDLGMDGVVAGFRKGYETPVGDGATDQLPAGIRQRIAIARALVRDPSVILFDEANMALDAGGDNALRAYLERIKGRKTIVLVTHRPSLLSLADRRLELRDGRLWPMAEGNVLRMAASGPGAEPEIRAETPRPAQRAWDVTDCLDYFEETSDIAACLPPLLAALDWRGTPRELAEALPHLVPTLDVSGLRGAMSNLGYRSESYGTRLDRLQPALLPCLFVPATGAARLVVQIHDDGQLTAFDGDTLEITTFTPGREQGQAYVFLKAEETASPETVARANEPWTRGVIRRFRRLALITLAITVASTLLSLAPPIFVKSVFDQVLPSMAYDLGFYLVLGALIAVTLDWWLRTLKSRILSHMAGRSEYIIGINVFQRILGLPATSTERATVGQQIGRIKDLESLREFFLGPLALLVFELPATIIYVVVLAVLNPWVILVVAVAVALFAVLGVTTRARQRRHTLTAGAAAGDRWEFVTEAFTQLRAIRSVGGTERWLKRYRDLSGRSSLAEYSAAQFSERVSAAASFIGMTAGVGAMAVSVLGAMTGSLSGGAVMASMMIVWRLVGPLQNGFVAATTVARVGDSMRQLNNLMKLPVEREVGARQSIRPVARGEVSFQRVSFRYNPEADPALLGVTFTVPAGKVAAIAGPNGAGKSTILKMIVRAVAPQAGAIRIDGIDVRQLSPTDLRSQISYMPQNCDLFYGTIAQNLRLSHPTATNEELEWALGMADLLKDVKALPQGIHTRISDAHGTELPNGFRQRLSLARTLLKPAPIVLLDEPGNGLDADGDRALLAAIDWLRGRSTVFIVSHRPSHMRAADAVLFLEGGALKAVGPFDDVKKTVMAGLA
ncbi:peptidase domain-containing ABC transporter [Novispirillum sp. DQ9]|uniref:peptidase domain-containing ABC transporter n=1 Tax=Novispirillum sp. DQ9 TaxID=3398612 RepID=UPI003C7AA563